MTIEELKHEVSEELYKLGLYRSRNATAVYSFIDRLIDRAVQVGRDEKAGVIPSRRSI